MPTWRPPHTQVVASGLKEVDAIWLAPKRAATAVAAVAAAAAAPNKFKFKTWSGRQPNPVGSNYIRDVQVAFSEQHERYVKERVEKRREYVIRCGYYHNGLYTLSYDIGRPAVCVKYSCIYIPWVLS